MAPLKPSIWADILGYVRVNHPDLVRGWFVQLTAGDLTRGVLTVAARNLAQARYLEQHCARAFAAACQAATSRLVSVTFESDSEDGLTDEYGNSPPYAAAADYPQLNKDYVFENFVVGPCNRLAYAATVAVGESPGRAYNPLFLHGNVGLGKTHLLQAACHTVENSDKRAQTLYISCETFINHFIDAVERGALTQFRYRYRHVDALVIDDIQFLAERERSQEEFFHTFNTLHQAGRQIILSADCSPSEIPSLEERLVSRFNSGLVARLDPPCLETRMAIVSKKAKLRCIELPEDVMKLIASRIDSNIRELEGALTKVDALSQTRDGKITLALGLEALGEEGPQTTVTVEDILKVVTDWYSVRLTDLQGRKRTKSITRPRQISMYVARELTDLSLEEIGGYFGGRDHTTVLHASRLIATQRLEDPSLNRSLTEITHRLRHDRQRGEADGHNRP